MNVKLLSDPVNFAIVQLPGRKFPGVVFQGDTLNNILKEFLALKENIVNGNTEDIASEIYFLEETFMSALVFYETICSNNNIQLPYEQSAKNR